MTSSYQIVLNDTLRGVPVPRVSEAAQAAAAEQHRQELLRARWVERDDAGLPDDIDRVLARDRVPLARANLKTGRVQKPNNTHWHRDVAARNALRADRARRVALGYAHPPPQSAFGNRGRDGGIDTHRYACRRYRPAGLQDRASTATACPLPAANRFETAFDLVPRRWTAQPGQGTSGAGRQGAAGAGRQGPARDNNRMRRTWQQVVRQFMGGQNRTSPVYAALMDLV